MTSLESMPNDDDSDPHALQDAADETPTEVTAPELSEQTKELVAWDEPPEAAGDEAPTVKPEDETSAVQELVEEGIDEADRDQRIAAEDPDFEPLGVASTQSQSQSTKAPFLVLARSSRSFITVGSISGCDSLDESEIRIGRAHAARWVIAHQCEQWIESYWIPLCGKSLKLIQFFWSNGPGFRLRSGSENYHKRKNQRQKNNPLR